jgi:hypothetical protein
MNEQHGALRAHLWTHAHLHELRTWGHVLLGSSTASVARRATCRHAVLAGDGRRQRPGWPDRSGATHDDVRQAHHQGRPSSRPSVHRDYVRRTGHRPDGRHARSVPQARTTHAPSPRRGRARERGEAGIKSFERYADLYLGKGDTPACASTSTSAGESSPPPGTVRTACRSLTVSARCVGAVEHVTNQIVRKVVGGEAPQGLLCQPCVTTCSSWSMPPYRTQSSTARPRSF